MSTTAQVSIKCHWLACTDSHLAENHHTTGGWYTVSHGFSYFL